MQTEVEPPKVIAPQRKAYAFERSLGLSKTEACRKVGGNPDNGQATKWEANKGVQAWIAYFRQKDLSDEMLREKRTRIEEALNSILFGDGADFPGENPAIDWTHRLNAANQVRDMLGLRAPSRTELTGKGGGAVQVQTLDMSKLSDDEISKLEIIFKPLADAARNDAADQGGEAAAVS